MNRSKSFLILAVSLVLLAGCATSEQAKQYVSELRAILLAVGASDAKMEEGSMRCDVNVSVHKPGTPFGTRCEIKNVNSIRAVGRAIDYEARRQIDIITSGGAIKQQTLHWDDAAGRTNVLRTKEDADLCAGPSRLACIKVEIDCDEGEGL